MSTNPTTSTCYRHRPDLTNRNSETPFDLSLDAVSSVDRAAITHVWSLFSSAPKKQRDLILKGILSVCCMPQLSFIYESLQPLLRIDFVSIFPRHVNFKIFGYLDATSLCQAAQVSHAWKLIADDERLWYIMCDQHTGKTCVKCGWGLSNKLKMVMACPPSPTPFLSSSSYHQQKQIPALPSNVTTTNTTTQPSLSNTKIDRTIASSAEPSLSTPPSESALSSRKRKHSSVSGLFGQFPRKKQQQQQQQQPISVNKSASFPLQSTSNTNDIRDDDPTSNENDDQLLPSIPRIEQPNNWKSLYRDRMIIEQNWRQNRFIQRSLSGGGSNGGGTENGVICIQVCDDLQVIMIGYDNNTIQVYDGESGNTNNNDNDTIRLDAQQSWGGGPRTTMVLASSLQCFQFDESKLIVGESDHSISIWDWHHGTRIRTLQGHHHTGPITALHFNDRNLLATGSTDQTIRLWDFAASQSFVLLGHQSPIRSLLLQQQQQKQLLVSSGDDQVIRIWDLATRQCIRALTGHNGGVLKVIPIPRLAMMTSPSPLLQLDQKTNGSLTGSNTNNNGSSSNGSSSNSSNSNSSNNNNKHSLILSCSNDNTIKIWDIQSGKCIRTMFGHMDHVTSLACDQFRIISGSKDRSLRIWSLNTGICQHVMTLEHPVDTVALSSTGILASSNGVGWIWDYSN